jgi:uncharacterized protein YdaU (DUF1376 family)
MKYQFMPMFWGDLLANTLDLSAEEAGGYLFLIAHAWEHKAKVPCERAQRIARISNFRWHKVGPRLQQFFNTSIDANNWLHERVLLELNRAAELSNKRKEAGRASAQQMLSKRLTLVPPSTLQLPIENPSLGKGSEAPEAKPARQGMSPDVGDGYRSPPRTKPDNPLQPLPAKFLKD